ncbi:MAG TPA: response regulator [Polyangiales bacterium]|nr:response regulator [Polyangiales bacterium]
MLRLCASYEFVQNDLASSLGDEVQSILREEVSAAPEPGATRILYIDADSALRASFARTISSRGFRVDTVSRPRQALRLAHRFMYPVIVAELKLPNFDGRALISELRALQPDASFVLASADESALFAPDPMLESIACRLRKPWEELELGQLVDGAVEKHRARTSPAAPSSTARWSVLLVEDDKSHAQLITHFLKNCGACGDVAHCSRLTSALALLQAQTFDVVLTDLDLPDAPGLDAIGLLQRAAPDAALIVVSGADEGLRPQLLELGAQDALVKGRFDRDTLRVRLQEAIEGKRKARAL